MRSLQRTLWAATLFFMSSGMALQADDFSWTPPGDFDPIGDEPAPQTVAVPVDDSVDVVLKDVINAAEYEAAEGNTEGTIFTATINFTSSISASEANLSFYSIGGSVGSEAEMVTAKVISVNGVAIEAGNQVEVTLLEGTEGSPEITLVGVETASGEEELLSSVEIEFNAGINAVNEIDGIILSQSAPEVPIPEPGTYALLGTGLALAMHRRRQQPCTE